MGNRLQKRKKKFRELPRMTNCPNCKKKFDKNETGHFVPPSLGEKGFFICEDLGLLKK